MARTTAELGGGASPRTASVLYVDLVRDRGSTFRIAVERVAEIALSLSVANLDFFEIADAVGPDGVFRGFP